MTDPNDKLTVEEVAVLKKYYNVEDVDALSEEEHRKIYEDIATFVGEEYMKAEDNKTSVDSFISTLDDIASYMSYRYRKSVEDVNENKEGD